MHMRYHADENRWPSVAPPGRRPTPARPHTAVMPDNTPGAASEPPEAAGTSATADRPVSPRRPTRRPRAGQCAARRTHEGGGRWPCRHMCAWCAWRVQRSLGGQRGRREPPPRARRVAPACTACGMLRNGRMVAATVVAAVVVAAAVVAAAAAVASWRRRRRAAAASAAEAAEEGLRWQWRRERRRKRRRRRR